MQETIQIKPKTPLEEQRDKERAKLLLMWLTVFSSVILFGGFSSAIIVRQSDANWFKFEIPFQFTLSTIIIAISSITLILGTFFTQKGNRWVATLFIFSTLALGIYFSILQYEGWKALIKMDIYPADPRTSNVSGSFFYVITALHLAHVVGGLIALLVTTLRSAWGKYKPDSYLGIKLCSIYWHFLGGLWLYLFLFWNFSDQLF